MRIGSLFSGYGGLDMGVQAVLGGDVAWHSDIDPGACRILSYRFPGVPNLGDITSLDWSQVEPVEVLTGGYPCQPFSTAGYRQGENDERHLWPYVREAIQHLRPRLALLENVAGHRTMGFDRVLGDLAEIGYDADWTSLRAADVGAPHGRERLFIAAHPQGIRGSERDAEGYAQAARSSSHGLGDAPRDVGGALRRWGRVLVRPCPQPLRVGTYTGNAANPEFWEWLMGLPAGWVTAVPGLTHPEQIKALGNGVVPQQAEAALRLLLARQVVAA